MTPRWALLPAALALAACARLLDVPELDRPMPATLAAVSALDLHPCNATTAAVLDALRVRREDLRSIHYERRVTGTEHRTLTGYDAWVRLAGQAGVLVVRHSPSCSFTTGYTQGELRLRQPSADAS